MSESVESSTGEPAPAEESVPAPATEAPAAEAPAPAADAPPPTAPVHPDPGDEQPSATRRPILATALAVLSLLAAALVWFVAQGRIGDLEDEVAALQADVEASSSNTSVESAIEDLDARTSQLESLLGIDGSPGGVDQSPAAIGTTLDPFTGTLWTTGEDLTLDPADGTVRMYLIAAHWCPYCGATVDALLPAWDSFELGRVEFLMISTAQDPTRGTTEDEYLTHVDPPWPVIIDPPGSPIAASMAVGSFPTWIATDGEGVVIGRFGGVIDDVVQFQGLIDQLRAIDEG